MQALNRHSESSLIKPLPEHLARDPQPFLLQTLEVPRGSVGTALFHAASAAIKGTWFSSDYMVSMEKVLYNLIPPFFSKLVSEDFT